MTQLKEVMDAVPDDVKDGIKVATIKTGAGITLYGFTLESLIAIATLVYFVLQIYVVVYKNWDALKAPWDKLKSWWASRGAA